MIKVINIIIFVNGWIVWVNCGVLRILVSYVKFGKKNVIFVNIVIKNEIIKN